MPDVNRVCKMFWAFALGCVAGVIVGVMVGYSYALPIFLEDQWVVSLFIGQEVVMSK